MPVMEGAYARLGQDRAYYDFAVDGGAVSTLNLRELRVPQGATILGGWLEVSTILGSGGTPTVGLNLETAGDLLAPVLFSGAPWSTTGRKSLIPVFTGASSIRTTAPRLVTATIAAAALTGGVFSVVLIWSEV